jgi:DNA-binding NtrC family response regulator
LDNSLPDGKGVEFIQKMKDAVPDLKVVMMTADPSVTVRPLALQRGASGFIAKPFKVSAMREIVCSIFPGLSAA